MSGSLVRRFLSVNLLRIIDLVHPVSRRHLAITSLPSLRTERITEKSLAPLSDFQYFVLIRNSVPLAVPMITGVAVRGTDVTGCGGVEPHARRCFLLHF